MQVEMKNRGLSGLQVCWALQSGRQVVKLRQIIVPVDLTHGCPTSIDCAIRFAKAFGSIVNLLHVYQKPDVMNQSSRSGGCDLFKEQSHRVFVVFYQLLRDTRNKHPDSIGYFEYGDPEREIDMIARQLRADLIIVSVRHATWYGKWLEHLSFRRHVDWILANAPCSVLVIQEGMRDLVGRTTPGA